MPNTLARFDVLGDRLLDEITTHVDAPTIQGLARALRNFTGGIILITHDR